MKNIQKKLMNLVKSRIGIVIFITLLVISFFIIISTIRKVIEKNKRIQAEERVLESEFSLNESENLIILRLEEENNLRSELDIIIQQHDNSRIEIENLNVDLNEKQTEINNLKFEIRELLNVTSDLKEAKNKIVILREISKKYFDKVDSLLGRTEELQIQNTSLITENNQIKTTNQDLNEENNNLNHRLDLGSTLEIFDIDIDKLKYNSRGQEKKVIFSKNIQVIRCCFKLALNVIAKAESKLVYIQYISPAGDLLKPSIFHEESVFVCQDSMMQSTTYSTFNYKNDEMEVCVDWQRIDILKRGTYKILFFIEGKLVEESSFKLY